MPSGRILDPHQTALSKSSCTGWVLKPDWPGGGGDGAERGTAVWTFEAYCLLFTLALWVYAAKAASSRKGDEATINPVCKDIFWQVGVLCTETGAG